MTPLRKATMVVALSLILVAAWVLVRYEEPPPKPRPKGPNTILSIYQTARAAGATIEGDSVEEVVQRLIDGVRGAGSFSDTMFQAPALSPQELETTLPQLTLVDGVLTRAATGSENP